MTINKLVAGAKGAAGNSTGADVAAAVNGLIDNTSLAYVESTPDGFTWPANLPEIKAIRSGDYFTANVKPEDLIDFSQFARTRFVDINRPDSSGNGLSWATAYRGIGQAISDASLSGISTRIFVRGGVYPRGFSFSPSGPSVALGASITVEAVYGRVETGTFDNLNWSKTSGQTNVYQAARSQVNLVINPTVKNDDGSYVTLRNVSSIALCDSTPNSYFTDNVTLYVHEASSSPVNNLNTRALLNTRNCSLVGNHNIYMSNIDIQGGMDGALRVSGGVDNTIVVDNCTFKYALGGLPASPTPIDGAVVLGCKLFAAFDSEASRNSKDGFNLHIQGAVTPSMLTVRCKGFNNGQLTTTALSSNGITAHDGLKAIDIGGEWLGSVGTNAGHVNNGTQVWHFGSKAGVSMGDTYNGGAIDYGAFGVWSGSAQMWLDSCTDIGSQVGVFAGSGGASARIRRHSGVGTKSGDVQAY